VPTRSNLPSWLQCLAALSVDTRSSLALRSSVSLRFSLACSGVPRPCLRARVGKRNLAGYANAEFPQNTFWK